MTERNSMMEVRSVADRATGVYERIREALGTTETIRDRLKSNSTNALVADFVDAAFYAVEGRAESIKDNASNVSIIYCITLANVLEMFTVTLDLLLKRKYTAAHIDKIANHLWGLWSGLDMAMNLCPDRRAWSPPVAAAGILENIKKELAQSVMQ